MQWDLGFESKNCVHAQEKKSDRNRLKLLVVAGSRGEGIITDLDWACSSPTGSKVLQEGSFAGCLDVPVNLEAQFHLVLAIVCSQWWLRACW